MVLAPATRVAPASSDFHFILSAVLALLAAASLPRLFPGATPLQRALAAVLGALTCGHLKEVADLQRNPWGLPPAHLWWDSARDMGWNLAGALCGAAAWLLLAWVLRTSWRPSSQANASWNPKNPG